MLGVRMVTLTRFLCAPSEVIFMAKYTIIRMQKLNSFVSIGRSLKHAFREQETPNADPSKIQSNTHFFANDVATASQNFKKRMPEKIRKNAVLAVEFLITASPEVMQEKTKDAQDAYFADALKYLQDKHGAENVVYAGIHRDETTPHMYAYVVPLDERGKLNCRQFYGDKNALSDLQTDFTEKVGVPHGLERGIKGSKAKHTSIKQYYARVNAIENLFTPNEINLAKERKRRQEQARLKKEAEERARLAREAAERARLKKEAEEKAKLAREAEERARLKKEAEEQARLAAERAEKARLAAIAQARADAAEAAKEQYKLLRAEWFKRDPNKLREFDKTVDTSNFGWSGCLAALKFEAQEWENEAAAIEAAKERAKLREEAAMQEYKLLRRKWWDKDIEKLREFSDTVNTTKMSPFECLEALKAAEKIWEEQAQRAKQSNSTKETWEIRENPRDDYDSPSPF